MGSKFPTPVPKGMVKTPASGLMSPPPPPRRDQVVEHHHYHHSVNTELLAACRAAADLLLRCDAERMPSNLLPASDDEWEAVVVQLNDAIRSAEGA